MEKRALLAAILSVALLIIFNLLYTKYFIPKGYYKNPVVKKAEVPAKKEKRVVPVYKKSPGIRNYFVETPKYNATLISSGVRFKDFKLREYFQDIKKTEPIEMISAPEEGLPLEVYLETMPEIAVINYQGPKKLKFYLQNSTSQTLVFLAKTNNLTIKKYLKFKKDSYYIDMKIEILNNGKKELKNKLLIRGVFSPFAKATRYVFKGPFYYTDHLNEVKLKDTLTEYVGPLKYLGYEDAYFMVAVIPQFKENPNFRATFRKLSPDVDEFILWTPEFKLTPGKSKIFSFKVYIGPKKTEEMAKEYPLLAKALYFGIFDFIAKPLLYVMKFFHRFTHNFGWDIIIITILLRILFFPLNHMSYKSMKKMQEIQPIIQRIREKYKNDPQKLNQELMNIYRVHKINPFSGCLPILIQIPVFFAFYKMLLMAIELRHASFMLWINDLSAPERLYIDHFYIPLLGGIPLLTILMGVSMYVQQKLTPSSPDPLQSKLMLVTPIVLTILFINFPSGLVLYWFVNNILSIGQQVITLKLQKK